MAAIQLNPLQRQAVEYLNGPLLVLAGPGTGKTQLLSAKVEYILQNTDADASNILCLTFTEAGAQSMRDRLTSVIGRAANDLNIHTYHAFGSTLLALYKNYATEFTRQLDQPIDGVTQYKLIRQFQLQLPALNPLRTERYTCPIIDTIAAAKSARLSAADLAKIANHNQDTTAELNDEIPAILDRLVPRMPFERALDEVYIPLLELFLKYSSPNPIAGKIEPEANFYARELDHLIKTEQAKDKPSISTLTNWKRKTFELDSLGHYRLSNRIANLRLETVAEIMAQYDDYLNEKGLFDFADMIEQAIKILKTDAGFRATLSERYQYVLLDEFQDTNPSQFELIRLLTDYEQPNIMAVGDDDQAIYAFQGANASNLIDFRDTYGAEVITLTENYRSTQEILDLSRHIADQIDESFAKYHHTDKQLTAALDDQIRSTVGDASLISRHEFTSSDAEYFWIARQINDLISQGVPQREIAVITPKHACVTTLIPYLKSHPQINISYEKRENILEEPIIHELSTIARFVHTLANGGNPIDLLHEICSYPYWGITPATVAVHLQIPSRRTPNAIKLLLDSEDAQLITLANFLSALAAASHEAPLELLLNQIIGTEPIELTTTPDAASSNTTPDTAATSNTSPATSPNPTTSTSPTTTYTSPFLSYHTASDYSEFHLYELLNVLREHLNNYASTTSPKLADFVAFLDDYQTAQQAIINTSPYQESQNAVQVVTAHGSKGLEYRHVFLVSLNKLAWGDAKGNNDILTPPKNLVSIRHTGKTADEQLRLLFVAMTRARASLTMTNAIRDYSGKSPARLPYLDERLDEHDQPISPFLPTKRIVTHYEEFSDTDKQRAIQQQWLSAYQVLEPNLRATLEQCVEKYRLTATALTNFIDVIHCAPLGFYRSSILRARSDTYSPAISLGNVVHAVFRAVTEQHLTDQQALALIQSEAEKEPVPTADQFHELVAKATASLETSLREFSPILRHPHAKAEVDFFQEHLTLPDPTLSSPNHVIPITGKLDNFHIDEEAKTIEIYDFKTSKYQSGGWNTKNTTLYKYKLQLGFYKLLLNLSPQYRKYQVTRGHILFVSPDPNTGAVYDKPYDYNADDEAALKALMSAVYRHIKSLDFIDPSSPLALAADPDRSYDDILDFVDLVLNYRPTLTGANTGPTPLTPTSH